jgi:hypothetical protein
LILNFNGPPSDQTRIVRDLKKQGISGQALATILEEAGDSDDESYTIVRRLF